MNRRIAGVLALLLISACSARETRENEGAVCAFSAGTIDPHWGGPQAFSEDQPVQLRLFVLQCLSSSCDTDREASCTAILDGDVIRVESQAAWSTRTGPGACTADCGQLSAGCATPPLPTGTYTLRHGEDELVLTIPSQPEQAPCTRDPSL